MTKKQKKAVSDLHAAGNSAAQIAELIGLDANEVKRVLAKSDAPAAQPKPTPSGKRPPPPAPTESFRHRNLGARFGSHAPGHESSRVTVHGEGCATIRVGSDVAVPGGRGRVGL